MKRKLLILNSALLFACTSMYFGTGWSMVLFSFPIRPQLTVDNYYLQFVPQVTAATAFFTWMTLVMILSAIVMVVAEWRTSFRIAPLMVLLGVLAATGLTLAFIFPYNQAMAAGITDPAVLGRTLDRWMALNRVRVGIWTVQWLSMLAYFVVKSYQRDRIYETNRLAVPGAGGDLRGHRGERAGAAART